MVRQTILTTRFDSRKSFYGKALVHTLDNGSIVLQSYKTMVAKLDNGKAFCNGSYSVTTLRHIKEFFRQYQGIAYTKKEIEAMPKFKA